MHFRYNIVLALAIFTSICFFSTATIFAAAWTQSKGTVQTIIAQNNYTAKSSYDINQHPDSAGSVFRKYEINPFIEYGFADDVTIGANPILQYWEQKTDTTRTGGQIFETEFFIRKRIFELNGAVFSVQPLVKPPCLQMSGPATVLCDSTDLEMRLLAGYGFKFAKKLSNGKLRPFSGQYHFVNLESAYRKRIGNFPDQIKLDGTAGFRVNENILLLGQFFSAVATTTEAPAIPSQQNNIDRYANLKLQLSGVVQTGQASSMQIGVYGGVYSDVAEGKFKTYKGVMMSLWRGF